MDYPRDKLARDFFCDTRFNSFCASANLVGSVIKTSKLVFATLALTSFQHLSKCYQQIFYEFFKAGEIFVCFLKKLY